MFWYRKHVPEDLVSVIGKKGLRRSLNTRDPAVAKVEHAHISAEVESQWRNLRQGVRSISQKQAFTIAGEIYREIVSQNEDNPGNLNTWGAMLLSDWAVLKPEKVKVSKLTTPAQKAVCENARLNRHARIVRDYLSRKGLLVDAESLDRSKIAVNEAVCQAREHILRNAKGDYRPDPDAGRFPQLELDAKPLLETATDASMLPTTIFDSYAKEAELSYATIKSWRPMIAKVEE
ncbi:DUF6538 domain-containing protein [Microvirga flocculans]|uniref:DUF6538 domain-containing protein n=1 Tax=Microvirga flocculans TaxID=217168 RepID=UPI0034A2654F